jgi:pyrroloquinoline quinone (PQQ) biosynthesis protein C
MNFIVGARQEMHEIFWAGLARNLFEESGGGVTPAHNELYRQFLRSTGVASDRNIAERPFSSHFNERWRKFAREEPIENAVLAIAIYEILDRPDYQSLYDALSGIDERWNLEFFRLHSAVEHFDMFTEFVDWFYKNVDKAGDQFRSVSDFVITTQRDMWIGLLHELESSPRHDPALQQRDRLFVD